MTRRRALKLLGALLALTACAPGPAGAVPSPFALRGIKGLWWQGGEKYRLALPWLARHRMNFLMVCYTSYPASGLRWRSEYTAAEKAEIGSLARQADRLGVRLCVSVNPGIWSNPPLGYGDEGDYQLLIGKVRTLRRLGVRWIGLCLDDISRALTPEDQARFGKLEAAQVNLVNRLWCDMRARDPAMRLIFCPSAYTTEDAHAHADYIRAIGEGLDPAVMVFWTGPTVCSPAMTAADARAFGAMVRRKPFVWDNYPVNDMYPWRPLLAPPSGRSADLAGEVSGYLANPMKQWYASTIPLAALSRYLTSPGTYDPKQGLRQALLEYAKGDRPAVVLLVELYGNRFLGQAGYPPEPRPRSGAEAAALLARYKRMRRALMARPALRGLWADVRETVEADIRLLERRNRNGPTVSPLRADGDEMEGGAGELYGTEKYGRRVNYVYAVPTGRSSMRVTLTARRAAEGGAYLRVTGRSDDLGGRARIRIAVNGRAVFEGASPFANDAFETRSFYVPAGWIETGAVRVEVANTEPEGALGMPPWFMVASVELAISAEREAR